MAPRAFVSGCETTSLSDAEKVFFREAEPWGLILFQRNCESPEQVRRLTADYRDCVGRSDAPVLIDQEGGRVQRLKPPHWRAYPRARQFGAVYAADPERGVRAAFNCARLIAADLHELGINVDCLPVADVGQPGAHDVIGDRAYGKTPGVVSTLAKAASEGLMAGGVLPVVKHIPGHGRAMADSHFELPTVDAGRAELSETDFAPFKALNGIPFAMTAHVVYPALDPDAPATHSRKIVQEVIRVELGFDGVLLTDDLTMNALSGTLRQRASAALEAGCDIALHCNGILAQMEEVAEVAPEMTDDCARRAERALGMIEEPREYDVDEALSDLDLAIHESV